MKSNIKPVKSPSRNIPNIIFLIYGWEQGVQTCLLTLNSAGSLLAVLTARLLCFKPRMPIFNMGEALQRFFSWQQSITIQTLCHSVFTPIQLLLTVFESVWGCFGSCKGLVKGQVQKEGGAWSSSRRGHCVWVQPTHILQGSALSSQPSPVCGELFVFPFTVSWPHE